MKATNASAIAVRDEFETRQEAVLNEYEFKIKTVNGVAIFETGRLLKEFKENNAGTWLALLDRVDMTHQRAYEAINVYDRFSHCRISGNFSSVLSQSAMILLGAPSTPEEVFNDVIDLVEGGDKVTYKEVKGWVAQAKGEEPKAKKKRTKPKLDDDPPAKPPEPAKPNALNSAPLKSDSLAGRLFPQPKPSHEMELIKAYLKAMGWFSDILRDALEWDEKGRPLEGEDE